MKLGKKEINFDNNYFIMGILNVTPDSFYDGGRKNTLEKALEHFRQMEKDGADIIDIGGESTRPGAKEVSQEEELDRVIPVIENIRKESDIPISIDTYKSKVADVALEKGANLINDISGLKFDPKMIEIAKKYYVPVIIQHIKGTPKTMQSNPQYDDLISEIKNFFIEQIRFSKSHGVNDIILDPGIGFGKNKEHNLNIIAKLEKLKIENYPILIGVSRKRFIGEILNVEPDERLFGTASAVALSLFNGANILRVHDVKEMKQVAEVAYQIMKFKQYLNNIK